MLFDEKTRKIISSEMIAKVLQIGEDRNFMVFLLDD